MNVQKVGDITGRALQNPSPQSSGSGKLADSTMMAFLWGRMTEIYGHKWASSYGPKPTDVWSKQISVLSRDEIKRGVMACLDSGDAWPPSLPEFLAMCRVPKRENAAAYRYGLMLTAPVCEPQKARAEIAKIRSMLIGG